MGYYYYRQSGHINRKLLETSAVVGSNTRVALFSRNVRRVGLTVIITFPLLILVLLLALFLDGTGLPYYTVITPLWAVSHTHHTHRLGATPTRSPRGMAAHAPTGPLAMALAWHIDGSGMVAHRRIFLPSYRNLPCRRA